MSNIEGKNSQPSMEEILQTIRGVISDTQDTNITPTPENIKNKTNTSIAEEDEDVLVLTDIVDEEHEDQQPIQNTKQKLFDQGGSVLDNLDNVLSESENAHDEEYLDDDEFEEDEDILQLNEFDDELYEHEEEYIDDEDEEEYENLEFDESHTIEDEYADIDEDNLISKESATTSTEALRELISTLPKPRIQSIGTRSGTTIEDIIIEMMKPMLADWLDNNLPVIVKQLVQKEIKKIIPEDE